MLVLLEQARQQGCELVVFPELALTTFFPRWFMPDQAQVDTWFEARMPSDTTRPLFDFSREHGIAISFGYAELTPEGQHFNTSIITDRQGNIVGKYRKVHLPGHVEFDTTRDFQHLEKRYFLPGDPVTAIVIPAMKTAGCRGARGACSSASLSRWRVRPRWQRSA
jgi:predicted amidohydrolase